MSMRTIFVPWWPGNASDAQLEAALAVARRVEAHLDVVFVRPEPAQIIAALRGTALAPAALAEEIDSGSRGAAADAHARFRAWSERHSLPGEIVDGQLRSVFAHWSERVGLPEQVIVRKGRLSDLTVLSVPDAGGTLDRALDAALFETGRPVLAVPQHVPQDLLWHVVIAWNGSLEATRAVVGAMALLHQAERVTVLTTTGPADRAFASDPVAEDWDLSSALRWHGIRAGHSQLVADETSAGAALLQTVSDQRATLLIMGAYTHSRVTAAFLGGVTGHVLQNPPLIPVLMAH
jgi:nucleotide-binding universal stress UspA family protein